MALKDRMMESVMQNMMQHVALGGAGVCPQAVEGDGDDDEDDGDDDDDDEEEDEGGDGDLCPQAVEDDGGGDEGYRELR